MASFSHLVLLLATCTVPTIIAAAAPSSPPSQSPSPPDKCSDVVMGLMDCLDYVEQGSKVAAPSKKCCGELATIITTSPSCLCEGFKMAGDLGIKLDMARAMGLPQACKLPVPADAARCALSPTPAPAPAPVPVSPIAPSRPVSPDAPPQPAPSPAPVSPAPPALPTIPSPPQPQVRVLPAPSPAPFVSGTWQLTSSMLVPCVAAAVASFSYLQMFTLPY